jgi:hypothetical protein
MGKRVTEASGMRRVISRGDREAGGRGHRADEFQRRSVLYSRLDARLFDRTRFFAAAALINAVLAELFELFPVVRSPRSFTFVNEVGAALEEANLRYADEISRRTRRRQTITRCRHTLDDTLVRAEQRVLQSYVQAHQAQCPRQWESVRSELNSLLNDRHAASLISRWCSAGGRLSRVLREVRGRLGTALDFASESHRIRIGLAVIEHIRREPQRPRRCVGFDLRRVCALSDRSREASVIALRDQPLVVETVH